MRLWAFCLLLFPLLLPAEDTASVRIVPEQLFPGEPFRMEILINSTDGFPGPALHISNELPALEQIPLRFAGQRISTRNTTTLLISGVAPDAPGDYTLPAFTATFAIRKVSIPSSHIKVKPQPAGSATGFAHFSIEIPDRTFFVGETLPVRLILDHGTQEHVTGFYGIDARGEGLVCRNSGQGSRPAEGPLQAELEVTPTQAGQLELHVGGMALVESTSTGASTSRDRPFLFNRKLRVAHVPERDRPADWNGAVGILTAVSATVSNLSPGIGEPTTLSLTLKGKGNLDRLLAPEVPHGDAWDVQPISSPRTSRTSSDQRTFTYTLIPRLPGKLRTPAVRLSYFNPEAARFERIEFAPVEVSVTGQAPEKVDLVPVESLTSRSSSAQAVAPSVELATPLPTSGRSTATLPLLAHPAILIWLQVGFLGALALALVWAARRDWLARHPEYVRRHTARTALRKARLAMRKAETSGMASAHAQAAVMALRAGAAGCAAATDVALTAEDVLRVVPELAHPQAVRAVFRHADGTRFGGKHPADTLGAHAALEHCLAQMESRLCD